MRREVDWPEADWPGRELNTLTKVAPTGACIGAFDALSVPLTNAPANAVSAGWAWDVTHHSLPRRIVMTWKADWDGGHVTTITYELQAIPGGTRLTLRHTGFGDRIDSCNGHANGWQRVLTWLCAFFPESAHS